MWMLFQEIWTRLGAPEPLSLAAFPLGVFLLLAASGIVSGARYGDFSLPSPQGRKQKTAWMIVGTALILFGITFSLTRPVYKPWLSSKLIYTGHDAAQIVADGEDVFLLTESGNIFRIAENGPQLEDDGTGTSQIAAAGGVQYILKNSGNIWLRQSVRDNRFQIKDPGTGTKQIVPAGETLYVLKNNGNIWKSITADPEPARFIAIDPGTNTKMMSSAGSVLYVLKNSGTVFQYLPVQQGTFQEILDDKGGRIDADAIKADGGTLYFIHKNGTTWKYKNGSFSIVEREKIAGKIDALGGVLYILTNEGEIIRYASPRERVKLSDAGDDNRDIAAYGRDLFAIKRNGSVWRYNEVILKR
jgi:hypothetical protein